MILVAGCGETTTPTDASLGDRDAAPAPDTGGDGGSVDTGDGGHELDAAPADDGGRLDGGIAFDARESDAPNDATAGDATDSGGALDAADATLGVDAGTDRAVPIDIGLAGDGSCLLTDGNEMWCWGYGNTIPVFVADAVELNGTCGVALDGHAFCWTSSGIRSYPSTDVAVLGVRTYTSRPAGEVADFGHIIAPWAPPVPVAAMPAADCAIDINGGLTCWDTVDIDPSPTVTALGFGNFYDVVPSGATYDVTDAARRGGIATEDLVVCYTWTGSRPRAGGGTLMGPGIECLHTRGTATPAQFAGASEVEMNGGRACVVVPVAAPGQPAGVYCTTDRPAAFGSSGHWPLNSLPAGDALNAYTNVAGTNLAVGANHACIMQDGSVLCWGANNRGQLGDGTMVASRAPVRTMW